MSSLQDDKMAWGISMAWLMRGRDFLRCREHEDNEKVQTCLRISDGSLEQAAINNSNSKLCGPSMMQSPPLSL